METISEMAVFFNASEEAVKRQAVECIEGLRSQYQRALASGKKVGGLTASELASVIEKYESDWKSKGLKF